MTSGNDFHAKINIDALAIGASDIQEIDRDYHLVVKAAIERHRNGDRAPLTFHEYMDVGPINVDGIKYVE